MPGEIAAAGDALTGGILASAVEPDRGTAHGPAQDTCLNCNTVLTGAFCHACGQRGHVHRTISAIGHEIAHGVFHFEGKIWRTLPLLFFKPGDLTRRYIHGERARFVTPLALFLFSVFLMVATFGWVGGPISTDDLGKGESYNAVKVTRDKEIVAIRAKIAALEGKRAQAITARQPAGDIDGDLKEARSDLDELIKDQRSSAEVLADELKSAKATVAKLEQQRKVAVSTGLPTAEIDKKLKKARDDVVGFAIGSKIVDGFDPSDFDSDDNFTNIHSNWQQLDEALKRASENPKLLIYKLQSSAYKFSWALIPISTPFVWLLFFWRRRFKMYDHAVFVTYSLSFMTLLVVILSLAGAIGASSTFIGVGIGIVPIVHMYLQLKKAYGLGWLGACVRTFLMINFAFIALSMFGLLLLMLGVME
jgi:hypothetical protein